MKSTRSTVLRVAAVQMKFADTMAGNLSRIDTAVRIAARRRADVVLFPECATTGYRIDLRRPDRNEIRDALLHVGSLAAKHRLNVLVGSPVFRAGKLQNCLIAFDRRGRVIHCYSKCHLTALDRRIFTPGNSIALFNVDGVTATAIICHERRYPELVRLAVMAGARILFHPNAGLDSLLVSRRKRNGRDGVAVRAFENAIYYVFANSVGPQGGGKWSAGDSKIVGPDGRCLRLADNKSEAVLVAEIDLAQATRQYAVEGCRHPKFLARSWSQMITRVQRHADEGCLPVIC